MALHRDEPRSLGGYRITERLGSGGMGVVYRARSRSGREVAVKLVHAHYAEDDVFRARFRQEIEAVRKVSGAFTAPVLDADPEADRPWMATQYVPAPSLADRIRADGPLTGGELRRLALGLVEALREIHRAGVVHRDLKPANVLMAEDGPRVIDFGISRAAGNQTLTETGHLFGTPPFMSPEQLTDARTAGPASDVFSLGALLVHAATGRGPFDADSPYLTAYRVLNGDPTLEQVPPALRPVLSRCLSKKPADRPELDELAEEFAAALPDAGSADLPTVTPSPAPPARTADPATPAATSAPRRRRTRLLALAGAAGVAAVALVAYLLVPADGSSAERAPAPERWAAVPEGWRPWTTTVDARAASGVTRAPENSGDTGTPSCATAGAALYCLGASGLPVRVDTLTGRTLWRTDSAPSGAAYGRYEGEVLGVHDGVVLMRQAPLFGGQDSRSTTSVVALDAGDGRRLWSRPVLDRDMEVTLAAGLALTAEGGDSTVTARTPRDGTRRWSATLPAAHACDFHSAGKSLYALCARHDGDDPGARLLAVDPADGSVRPLSRAALFTRYLGTVGGRLLLAEEDPESTRNGGDQAYTRLVLVDPAKGTRQTVSLPAGTAGEPALVHGTLLFAGSNGQVTAVSPTRGTRLWQARTTLEQPGTPLGDARGRTVFLASGSGRAAALDARTGRILWESLARAARASDNGSRPSLFRQEGALVVAAPDGTLFSLDPSAPDRAPTEV